MNRTLDNPFYYLENFHRVTEWIGARYSDLLDEDERGFITRFADLPQASRALLVRMVMRKGDLFRASKLRYVEIGCARRAAAPLAALGWIDEHPLLTPEQAFGLLTKSEIAAAFRHPALPASATKSELLDALRAEHAQPHRFDAWLPATDDRVYYVRIKPLCERLRLMFFGNLHQDWTEFVLADLGIYRYEKVDISASSRGFRTRADVDTYLRLRACRERLERGDEPVDALLRDIPAEPENDWLRSRRAKLLFQLAQHCERTGDLARALDIYSACAWPGARARAIRVREISGQSESAFALAQQALQMPESESERQQLARLLPRLRRKLGLPPMPARAPLPVERIDLLLPRPQAGDCVEQAAARHLARHDAPVYYVENTLVSSLFGLLCWDAVFAAVPGAFIHPFHTGPADLHSPDFQRRREREFRACLAQLDGGDYIGTINRNFAAKRGIQSPFVTWQALDAELKDLALACMPAAHLKKLFERILQDVRANCAGLPDLIQFWPAEKSCRMIEVKGPGDRLQDNQVRWLDYCSAQHIPVAACYVQWAQAQA